MPTAVYDLRYLRAGIELLERYLLASDVYWPVGVSSPAGTPPYPQLTLSGLMLASLRAQARAASPAQRTELEQLKAQMNGIRSQWRVAWEQKATAEFRARLTLWRNFLEDYRDNRATNADRYPYEVHRRVQLHLLQGEASNLPDSERSLLSGMDQLLRATLVPGDFVWDKELEDSFPRDPYWYLYGRLKEEA